MNKKSEFVPVLITSKNRQDKTIHVWATVENGEIISISEPSGKILKMPSSGTVIFNGEEYYFYPEVVLKK
ncbi:hypothetical protein AVENLUH7437_00637 [Acinetobacter venetianus]|nr:hypothetical protein AVENLUH7437_00637 [Acinetobacter venetianus]